MNEPKRYTKSAEIRISWQTTSGVIDGVQEWDLELISVDIDGKPACISDEAALELIDAICDE